MHERSPDLAYPDASSTDQDREIDNVILPIAIFGGAVMLFVCFLAG